jgi:tetratricopeptide (TPR) repeat protein
MKNSNITRYASFLLVIGFFISCSSSKFSAEKLINEGKYQEAIEKIDIELDKNPNANLYFQKGELYGIVAKEKPLDDRDSSYRNMVEAFDSARVYSTELNDNSIVSKVDSLTYYYWDLEHQAGLSEYEKDSEQSLMMSINHFNNAVVIDPLQIKSYKSLSIALYNLDDINRAIETLERAESVNNNDTEVLENLGFLYLEVGNPEQSINYYKKANQDPVKNKNIAYGLVNAYISQNRISEAASFLSKLVMEYPNDAKLHNVYGTQLYNQVSQLFSNLNAAFSSNDTSTVNTLIVEIEGLSESAENELVEAYKADTSDIEYTESLAVFYNNMSGNYFSTLNVAFDSNRNEIETKALTLTNFAITYYGKLVELNGDNASYSRKIDNLNSLKNSWTDK